MARRVGMFSQKVWLVITCQLFARSEIFMTDLSLKSDYSIEALIGVNGLISKM